MNIIVHYKSGLLPFILILFLCIFTTDTRPESSGDLIQVNHKIEWIAEFSSSKDFSENQNILSRFFDLLTGTETIDLLRPKSVLASNSGLITVLDQEMRSIVQIDPLNHQIDLIQASSTTAFPSLLALCSNEDNEIYFTDSQDNQIYLLSSPGGEPVILNKSLQLNRPTGIAYHQQNREIWVVETADHRISVLDSNGHHLRYIGKRGLNSGEFNFPSFIWIDKAGIVYIVDTMNYRVQIMDGKGNVVTIFGKAGDGSGYFARPKGIATDSEGNIYVVDALFHTVQIFDKQGNFLYNFGQQGQRQGEFWMPSGIYIDEHDKIYIADSYNARIQIFQLKKESGEN